MTPYRQAEVQQIVERIEDDSASGNDVLALLIYLREYLSDQDPVRDIAHCAAHTQRDRGIAFTYIERFLREFIYAVQHGGRFTVKVLFPVDKVIEQLFVDLQALNLRIQPDTFRQRTALLRTHLGDILDGVTLKVRNPHVVECWFSTADSNPSPSFNVRFNGLEKAKVVQIYPNAAFAFPVLTV